jgi:uncharacterized protein (DUF4415 family)
MSKTNKNSKDEFILEVTQEEYDKAMKKGWTDDDIQKPGKHRYRRAKQFAKPEDLLPSNIKVDVNLKIDLDIFEHFEQHHENYQAEINNILRAEMERNLAKEKAEKEFIKAVAEQVKELIEA